MSLIEQDKRKEYIKYSYVTEKELERKIKY
jgi:hypothetical protein